MTNRYLIAIPLPADKETQLKTLYREIVGEELPISTMHISLEFPFTLSDKVREEEFVDRIASFYFDRFIASVKKVGIFTQLGKKILYLHLQPEEGFQDLHNLIRRQLQEYYGLDTSIYSDGVVPMYEPHLTLNYDSTIQHDVMKKLEAKLLGFDIPIENIQVLKELEKGVWVTMGSNH